jgi:acetyl esterase/lipase
MRLFLAALASAGLVTSTLAQSSPTATVTYATLGSVTLDLDVYVPPTGTGPFPCVVFIHGGSWWSGDKYPLPPACEAMLTAEIGVVSANYRLTTQAPFPAQIHDVKAAIRWVHNFASTYNLDDTRVGIFGQSAGSHLAVLAAVSCGVSSLEGTVGSSLTYSSCVDVGAAYYGIYDFYNLAGDVTTPPGYFWDHNDPSSPESALFAWTGTGQGLGDIIANWTNPSSPYPALVSLVQDATPLTWIDSSDPPLFFLHGTADNFVPVNQSARLSAGLYAAGVRHDYRAVPGAAHHPFMGTAEDATVTFFSDFFGVNGLPAVAGSPFCSGDDPVNNPCPCSNESQAGAFQGCKSSLLVGASLYAEGVASVSNDTLVLRGVSMPNSTCVYVQGTSAATPSLLNDGLFCLGGTISRLRTLTNGNGFSQLPVPGGFSISVLGGVSSGSTYYYQCDYRNSASWCTSDTNNWSAGVSVAWGP